MCLLNTGNLLRLLAAVQVCMHAVFKSKISVRGCLHTTIVLKKFQVHRFRSFCTSKTSECFSLLMNSLPFLKVRTYDANIFTDFDGREGMGNLVWDEENQDGQPRFGLTIFSL